MSCCVKRRQAQALGFHLIDAYTETDVLLGQPVPMPDGGSYTVLKVDVGFFRSSAHIVMGGLAFKYPITVTSKHPNFPGQRVALISI